jgi:hypothetical protein
MKTPGLGSPAQKTIGQRQHSRIVSALQAPATTQPPDNWQHIGDVLDRILAQLARNSLAHSGNGAVSITERYPNDA